MSEDSVDKVVSASKTPEFNPSSEAVLETIMTRRSIREFKKTPVPEELLKRVIECGLRAPSAKNSQPWRFHVIRDKETLEKVAGLLLSNPEAKEDGPIDPKTGKPNPNFTPTVVESANIVKSAPVAIFIENHSPVMGGRKGVIESPHVDQAIFGLQFELMGIGSSVENMLLAAHSQGLGGVFMGDPVLEEDNIKKLLGIQGDLVGVVALGYSDQKELWNKPLEKDRVIYH